MKIPSTDIHNKMPRPILIKTRGITYRTGRFMGIQQENESLQNITAIRYGLATIIALFGLIGFRFSGVKHRLIHLSVDI
jgi:hypothetical protein